MAKNTVAYHKIETGLGADNGRSHIGNPTNRSPHRVPRRWPAGAAREFVGQRAGVRVGISGPDEPGHSLMQLTQRIEKRRPSRS